MGQTFYEIEILDESIELNGHHFKKSVKVTQYYAQKKISEKYLGNVEVETIYHHLDAGHEIDLDYCYIKDFSLHEYRRSRKLEEKELVTINSLSAKGAFFDCDAYTDMSYAVFKNGVSFDHAVFSHGSLNFTHSRFEGELVDFSDCNFHSHQTIFQYTEFECEKTNFENSNFNGEILSFINATIKTKTFNFKRVNFNSCRVKFHFVEFGDGDKLFEKIKFFGPVLDFRRVIWASGKIDFRRSLFGGGLMTFEESEMSAGKTTFRLAKFLDGDITFRRTDFGSEEANFDHVSFGGNNISFEGCTAEKISISNSNIRSTIDLRIKKAKEIDLSDSYLHSITDLNFQKHEALRILKIAGTRNLGKIIIDWKDNNVKNLILNQKAEDPVLADQFNVLKDNFTKNGQYADEDWAYVYYKRYEHKAMLAEDLKKYKAVFPLVRLLYFLRKLVFDKIGLFATSPSRVFVSMIVALTVFAAIYVSLQWAGMGEIINSVDADDNLNMYQKSLYHSAITFFTIGYGDYYPTSWCIIVSATEGLVGVFLMSYFTVAFVRKALR